MSEFRVALLSGLLGLLLTSPDLAPTTQVNAKLNDQFWCQVLPTMGLQKPFIFYNQ